LILYKIPLSLDRVSCTSPIPESGMGDLLTKKKEVLYEIIYVESYNSYKWEIKRFSPKQWAVLIHAV